MKNYTLNLAKYCPMNSNPSSSATLRFSHFQFVICNYRFLPPFTAHTPPSPLDSDRRGAGILDGAIFLSSELGYRPGAGHKAGVAAIDKAE